MMLPILISVSVAPGSYFFCASASLLDAAARDGLNVIDLVLRRPNLESVFLQLTGRDLRQ